MTGTKTMQITLPTKVAQFRSKRRQSANACADMQIGGAARVLGGDSEPRRDVSSPLAP